jgi:cytochrome c-type biogenesis protein CcmF
MLAWQAEDIRVLKLGESVEVSGYTLTLNDVRQDKGPNYLTTKADFSLSKSGVLLGPMYPEKRVYPVAKMPTTEAAIDIGFWRDIYVVIGDPQDNGGWAVRSYVKPLANWIWGGAILMALGGALSLSDRRYRIAAGARRRRAVGVPAE